MTAPFEVVRNGTFPKDFRTNTTGIQPGGYQVLDRGTEYVWSQGFDECIPVLVVNKKSDAGVLCHLEKEQYHGDYEPKLAKDPFSAMVSELEGEPSDYEVHVWDGQTSLRTALKIKSESEEDARKDVVMRVTEDWIGEDWKDHFEDHSGEGGVETVIFAPKDKKIYLLP
eukprot:TRINITY_DN39253_c0_g1_i1.p1 TRINITY_DN39253_c0_g1~~TRINITY_DN39253_c0_g1_i1.p1  ORF type:complete len:169 (-),score=36.52 TRINITY_DN39253_c0_g1_i1:179-685(-)